MPIKPPPATDLATKRTIAKPPSAGALATPRKPASGTDPNSNIGVGRQPAAQRASALPKRASAGKITALPKQSSDADADLKTSPTEPGPELTEEAVQSDADCPQTTLAGIEESVENNPSTDSKKSSSNLTPKSSVSSRPTLIGTKPSTNVARPSSATTPPVSAQSSAVRNTSRRGSNTAREESATPASASAGNQKLLPRSSKLRIPSSAAAVRSNLPSAANVPEETDNGDASTVESEKPPIQETAAVLEIKPQVETDSNATVVTGNELTAEPNKALETTAASADVEPGVENDVEAESASGKIEATHSDVEIESVSAAATDYGSGSHAPSSAVVSPAKTPNSATLNPLGDLDRLSRENAELRLANCRLLEQLAERERELRESTTAISNQRDQLTQHEHQIEEHRSLVARLQRENAELQVGVDKSRFETERLNCLITALRTERETLIRKFDVLSIVVGSLQRHTESVTDRCVRLDEANRELLTQAEERSRNLAALTLQLSEQAQRHAEETDAAKKQFSTDLRALEDRANEQRLSLDDRIREQHNADLQSLRDWHSQQLAFEQVSREQALKNAETTHLWQLGELNKRHERQLSELDAMHQQKQQQLETNFASARAFYEDRIETLQADCNDLRHRVQLYEHTLQKQATVRCHIEPPGRLAAMPLERIESRVAGTGADSDRSGSSLSSSADSLTASPRATLPQPPVSLARDRDAFRFRCQSVSRCSNDNTIASNAHLQQEIASLNAVLELRNGELRDLRKQYADLQLVQADYAEARNKIRELQMQIENLDALLAIKTDSEKALTEKHNMLLRKFEKESKASKRLSMDYEEARFKLEQLEDAARMRAEGESSPRIAVTSPLATSLPTQSPMTISCPNHAAVFGSTKHRHSSTSSSSGMALSPRTRSFISRPSSAHSSTSRPRSYHAGQSFIPTPSSSGTATMRKSRAGTVPPERVADSQSLYGSPPHLAGSGLLRASTPATDAWMVPLKEKAEETASSGSVSNSTANLSTSTSIVLPQTEAPAVSTPPPAGGDDGASVVPQCEVEMTPETLDSPASASVFDQSADGDEE